MNVVLHYFFCSLRVMERYFLDKNTSIIYYTSNVFAVIFTITFLYITWKYRHHFPLKEYDTPLMYLIVLTFMMILMAYLALNNIQDYVTKKTYGNSDKELFGMCILQIVFFIFVLYFGSSSFCIISCIKKNPFFYFGHSHRAQFL